MEKEIKRDYYLEQLIKRKGNGLIKNVTGIRRCGKSYLLRTLFKNYLLESGVDEVQLLEEFVSVLNGLADKKNCDVFVTRSNAKFLSRDIATEFGGRGDEVHMYPLSFSEFMTSYDGNRYDGCLIVRYWCVNLMRLTDKEQEYMDRFISKEYIPELLFDDYEIVKRIKGHPMALWKCCK